jgi:hypothetical protein
MILDIAYSLAGFDTINGRECVRIRAELRGRLEEGGVKMSRAPDMTAQFFGNGHWYFDHEEGVLLSGSMTIDGRGEMATSGGQGPPARITQKMTIVTELLE